VRVWKILNGRRLDFAFRGARALQDLRGRVLQDVLGRFIDHAVLDFLTASANRSWPTISTSSRRAADLTGKDALPTIAMITWPVAFHSRFNTADRVVLGIRAAKRMARIARFDPARLTLCSYGGAQRQKTNANKNKRARKDRGF
jgi:hypothetical protein